MKPSSCARLGKRDGADGNRRADGVMDVHAFVSVCLAGTVVPRTCRRLSPCVAPRLTTAQHKRSHRPRQLGHFDGCCDACAARQAVAQLNQMWGTKRKSAVGVAKTEG